MPRSNAKQAKQAKSGALTETQQRRQATLVLKDMPDKFLMCRSYRYHAFKQVSLEYWREGSARGISRTSVCSRCSMHAVDHYNLKGQRVAPREYDPPAGYGTSGLGYITSDMVMRELFARATNIAASESDAVATARHLSAVK